MLESLLRLLVILWARLVTFFAARWPGRKRPGRRREIRCPKCGSTSVAAYYGDRLKCAECGRVFS